jgi:nicotinamide mononucleotide transporter
VLDVVYVGEYIYKDLNLTAGLYAFFVLLAVLGLRGWRKALAEQPSLGAEAA